jgi:DNA-binding beta-propeller fold protein YncE
MPGMAVTDRKSVRSRRCGAGCTTPWNRSSNYSGAHPASSGVVPIRTATNTAGPAIPDADGAVAMVITPNGKTAYLLNSDAVIPIQTATNTPGTAIPVAGNSTAIAVTPANCGCT